MYTYRNWLMLALVALAAVAATGVLLWPGTASEAGYEKPIAPNADGTVAPAVHRDRGGSVWGKDYFPNVPLITHEGETVRFFDDMIEDKVVAINFIYTTCPDACPMETARLLEVQKLLGERMGKDIFFYSITIDPENDTPEVLNQYVKNWKIGPGWTFLTGKEEDIVRLRQKLGIYIEEIQAEDSNDHNLSLIIGNQSTGRWMKRSPYENPYILATQLGSWLHNWKMPSRAERSYEDAPELRDISTGELLFRTRCASCHTIGHGDVTDLDERRIGPDLYRVTEQRDPEWLRLWLKYPDKMLEQKDPLAMRLYEQYERVPMPNLRLNDTDVDNVLDYIEEASDRHDRERKQRQMAKAGHEDHHMQHGDHAEHPGDHAEHPGDHAEHPGDPGDGGERHEDHAEHGAHPATHR